MRDDDPEDLVGEAFGEAVFGEHPLGRPIIGSVDSIEAMTRTQLHSFHQRRYTPERMILAVAGNIDHDQVVRLAREYFGPWVVRRLTGRSSGDTIHPKRPLAEPVLRQRDDA